MINRRSLSFRAPVVAAVLAAAFTGSTHASVIIDFEALQAIGNPSQSIGPLNYLEDGYSVNFVNAARAGTTSIIYYGSTAVYSGEFFGTPPGITLTQSDAGAFDLLSVDLAERGNQIPYTIALTGTLVGGGTVTATLNTDGFFQTGNLDSFQTFLLSGFTNLTEVRFSYPDAGFGRPQLDNLVVQPAVPAPGAAAVLGLGGLLATRRRRTA